MNLHRTRLPTVFLTLGLLLLGSMALSQNELPIVVNDGGYIFVKVTINASDTARFMLDTGGGITLLSQHLFEKYKLREVGVHTGTRHNGESITGKLYELPSLSIGSLTKNNIVVGSYDALQNCDGLLSMDYFRDIPFTVDFKNERLIIESKETLKKIYKEGIKVPIQLKANGVNELGFFVRVCVNDSIPVEAEFDTGAGFNMLMLQPRYLKTLNITPPSTGSEDYGYYLYSTTLPSLEYCSNAHLRQTDVFVGFKEGLIYEGLIGSGMFRDKKLTIDIPDSVMIVR